MDIKKVAVLGAGAVGSYVIWGLSARRDIELGVVADGRAASVWQKKAVPSTEKSTVRRSGRRRRRMTPTFSSSA